QTLRTAVSSCQRCAARSRAVAGRTVFAASTRLGIVVDYSRAGIACYPQPAGSHLLYLGPLPDWGSGLVGQAHSNLCPGSGGHAAVHSDWRACGHIGRTHTVAEALAHAGA